MDILFISHVCFLREAMLATLQSADGIRAVGAFSHDTVEAAVSKSVPDLVIIDASHSDATTLVAAVRTQAPKVSVVVLAMREQDEEFLAWADIGIAGYLGPDTSAQDLLSTIRRAGAGEVVCPPRLSAVLLNRFATRSNERMIRAGIHALTSREREIAELLADGMSNKLIARRLSCALPTVKNHVHSILEKWDVRSRGEAAARFRRQLQAVEPNNAKLTAVRASQVSPMGGAPPRNGAIQHGMSSPAARSSAYGMTLMPRTSHSGQRS